MKSHQKSRAKWMKQKSLFKGQANLGLTYSYLILNSPRTMLFTYSRYKFAARLLGEEPKRSVLELGCCEGVGTLTLSEKGHNVTAIDFDEESIRWAQKNLNGKNIEFICDDFLGKKYGEYDAAISLDVIEHIYKRDETKFFRTLTENLKEDGFCVIGTPNVSTEKYSSKTSKAGHVNLYSPERLRDTAREHFKNVFMFGMNDEVVHTGFYPMCQYIICLGCGKI